MTHTRTEAAEPHVRPYTFTDPKAAVRWARHGGVALYDGFCPCLYADASAAQKSVSSGWARYWAGKAGVEFAEVKDRGTRAERIELTYEQANFLREQSIACELTSVSSTVVFFTGSPWLAGWPGEVPPELTCLDRIKLNDEHTKQAPLTRNRQMAEYAKWRKTGTDGAIVEAVACPKEREPPADGRGGTWHAIRMFRSAGIPVTIIPPNGVIRP